MRELELGTAPDDAPRLGPLAAGPAAVLLAVASAVLLWVLGGESRRLLLASLAMNAASALLGVVFWLD